MRLALLAFLVFFGAGFSTSSLAQRSGPATVIAPDFDKKKELDAVFEALAKAPNAGASQPIIDRLWLTWMMTPDAQSADDLNKAIRARRGYSYNTALDILDTLIARHPTYPESWNQRSYVHFLKEDYEKSLADCEHALTLEPRHIGCLSGMARILIRHQKRFDAGKKLLKKAMTLHPFIYEQVLLKEIPQSE